MSALFDAAFSLWTWARTDGLIYFGPASVLYWLLTVTGLGFALRSLKQVMVLEQTGKHRPLPWKESGIAVALTFASFLSYTLTGVEDAPALATLTLFAQLMLCSVSLCWMLGSVR